MENMIDKLIEGCHKLINAPHQEHFATRLNDEELAGLELIKAALPFVPIGMASAMEEGAENWKLEYDNCRHILSQLCALKTIKDTDGATEYYRTTKELVWKTAFEFLKQYTHL